MNINEILTTALAELGKLREILETQLEAVVKVQMERDRAKLQLEASRIQKDMEIRLAAEASGEKKPTESAIAGQVTLALVKEQTEIIEWEAEYRKAQNMLELTRFAIEIKKLEIKAHLPHAQQTVNITPSSSYS